MKEVLSTAPTLSLYDPCQETIVSADASSYGLGAVLLQKQKDRSLQPTVYASRAPTLTEQRYAQIEKEALALIWACEHFQEYLLGMHFQLHTDHKPLVSLLGSKALDSLPMRVTRFRLRLMRLKYTISHVPGTNLAIADALSRAPLSESNESVFAQEVEAYVHSIVDYLPISETRLKQILQSQEEDPVCQRIKDYCHNGWLPHDQVDVAVSPYYQAASELTTYQDLLMRGNQILIQSTIRKEILNQIHTGHQGITKC